MAQRINEEMLSIVAGEGFFNQAQKNSPHTESQSCNESMKSASFENTQRISELIQSGAEIVLRARLRVGCLAAFICSVVVRGET